MIDLYVPASAGSVTDAQARAAESGLDALVYVAHHPDDLPGPDDWSDEEGQPVVILGCAVEGMGYRMGILVDDWDDANFDVLEATDDLNLLVAAVGEMGGAAYAVCPHQTDSGEVVRQAARLADGSAAGLLAMVAGSSALSRELDIEQASRAERRVLGATGPFGNIEHIGRYATLIAVESLDAAGVVASLNAGLGVAVEIADGNGDGDRGRGGDGGGRDRKKRRRRSRRRRDDDRDSGGASEGGDDEGGEG